MTASDQSLKVRPLKSIAALPLEAKGGVGKSTVAHVMTLVLRDDSNKILVVDADKNNSTQSMIGDPRFVDMARVNWESRLITPLLQQRDKRWKHVIFDFAAGQERNVREIAPEMAAEVTQGNGMFVVARPLTSCGFVHDNIRSFVETTMTDDMRLLLVRNMARVDDHEDFDRWHGSRTRAMVRARGAVEIELENCGVALADRLINYRMSFEAFALGRWEESADPERAEKEFIDEDRHAVGRWLKRQKLVFHDARRALGA